VPIIDVYLGRLSRWRVSLCASLVTSRFLTGGGKIAREQRPRDDAASGAKSSEGFYFANTSLNHKTLGCFAFDRAFYPARFVPREIER